MSFHSSVFLILLGAFIVAAWYSGFWTVMGTWTPNTWAVFFLGMLITWIGRNEFGGTREK